MMSREKGDLLETRVSNALQINKTTNSGAKYQNGDIANRRYVIECKYRDKESFSIDKKDLKKLRQQALDTFRDWIYIQENNRGTFAVIDFELLVELLVNNHENRIPPKGS